MLPSAWLLSCHNTGLTGHRNSVRSLVVSPDGKFVATGCLTDNSIILWDPEGGAILAKWWGQATAPEDMSPYVILG